MRVWLCSILAACGGNSSVPAVDGGVDPDAPGPEATLTVTSEVYQSTYIEVFFQRADSTELSTVIVEHGQTAHGIMEPGGFVTVLDPFGRRNNADTIYTFANVQPGDQLRLDERAYQNTNMSITIPRVAGAPAYRITTSCGGWSDVPAPAGDAPVTGLVSVSCTGPIDVVASVITADDATTVLQSFSVTGVEVVADATIDLTAHAYTPAAVTNLHYVNVPSEDLPIAFYLAMPNGRVTIGADYPPVTGGTSQSVVETTAGAPLMTQSVFQTETSRRTLVEWGPAAGTDVTLDLAQKLLPAYTSMPVYDVVTHAVRWTSEPGTVTPQTTRFGMFGTDGENYWDWYIVGPYTGETIQLPTIPLTRSIDFNHSTDPYILNLETADVPYDAIRANAFSYTDLDDVIIGESGRVTTQTLPRDQHGQPF